MSGKAYFCHITLITEDMVVAEIDIEDDNGTELGNRITLFQ